MQLRNHLKLGASENNDEVISQTFIELGGDDKFPQDVQLWECPACGELSSEKGIRDFKKS
jgi:hypothetical protein